MTIRRFVKRATFALCVLVPFVVLVIATLVHQGAVAVVDFIDHRLLTPFDDWSER